MKKWVKVKRDSYDIEKGYQLCPICKQDTLEELQDDTYTYRERCSKGCYEYDLVLGVKVK